MPRFRMIHVDHYMCKPVSPFDDSHSEVSGRPTVKVPVIRIFGTDPQGHKICIHVHGFYPYVAIQNLEPDNPDLINRIITDIERSIKDLVEHNRQAPLQRERQQNEAQTSTGAPQQTNASNLNNQDEDLQARLKNERRPLIHLGADQKCPVHRVESIEAYNYYGYHKNPEKFFKLHLYNPKMVKQLALLFEDCRVLGRFIPIFWAHLPYILLFFIDNNLRGMQFIEVEQIYWRKNKAPHDAGEPTAHISLAESTSDNVLQFDDAPDNIGMFVTDIEPISSCELEGDIRFEWILNGKNFGSNGNDDALRDLWLDDQAETQRSQTLDPRLPLFELERNYLQQLTYSCGLDETDFNLPPITKLEKKKTSQDTLPGDSDNSTDAIEDPPLDDTLNGNPRIVAEEGKFEQSEPACDDDEFSDDGDDELVNRMILQALKSQQVQPKAQSQRSNTSSTRESVSHEYQHLCLMTMELHITTREKLRPDPMFDPIEAVFYCIRRDIPEMINEPSQVIGMILTDPFKLYNEIDGTPENMLNVSNLSFAQKVRTLLNKTGLSIKDLELNIVDTELELLMVLIDVVKLHDPEILMGYEMELLSWGYILERANALNMSIGPAFSRVSDTNLSHNSNVVESNFVQPIMFTGRLVMSIWRMIRHEINLTTCSYERIHHHALNERVPCFGFDTLTKWFNENRNRWRVIDYYLVRVVGQMRILDKFDLIAKVSEMARVYGTQFIDVITRGSQIGIESMMLRLAKLQNLTPLSPTVMQRNKMMAPEAIPLVLEPETNIYYDPVAVLDFQSLYPSVVIAYNYCYSTCLGRVVDLEKNERHNFGCGQLFVGREELTSLLKSNSITVSPCGVAFVKKNVRHGVLPKMLSELILTRAFVKEQMKKNMKSENPNRRLQRILDHRQHGLKMMANTTYGYTGASYTGRMPCVEIADSIVSKGRETLENAIELVESRSEWGAKVIYGDTDSIFIQFPNCDKSTAFKRAYEMVDAITAINPYPIKMKFEKIYQPCVLQTKKRYCGFKFETLEQAQPEFEAKGIETIRRDCCPAAARMLEMALRIQFTTRDINQVKEYVQHQFLKIMSGKLSNIQDFIFARKYKPRDMDKNESVFVPAWQITKRLLASDPRAEPRLNERVPFVIVYGQPKTPLVNLAKTPMEVLENLSYRVNAEYYIQKIICPTLNRIFCTMNVNTLLWYKSMPHQNITHRSHYLVAQKNQHSLGNDKQSTMSQYFSPSHCPVCAKPIPVSDDICDLCRENLQSSVIRLTEEITKNERKLFAYHQICKACSSLERDDEGGDEHQNPCISYDCHNLFRYHQARLDAFNCDFLSQILKGLN